MATAAPRAHSRSAPAARLLLLTLRPCATNDPNCPRPYRRKTRRLVCYVYARRDSGRTSPDRGRRGGRARGRRERGRRLRGGGVHLLGVRVDADGAGRRWLLPRARRRGGRRVRRLRGG